MDYEEGAKCPKQTKLVIGSASYYSWLPTAKGEGLSILTMNRGGVKRTKLIPVSEIGDNPSYCQGNCKVLYCVNDGTAQNSTVSRINLKTEKITSTSTKLSNAAHLAVFPQPAMEGGIRVAVANFDGSGEAGGVTSHVYKSGKWSLRDSDILPNELSGDFPYNGPHVHMILPTGDGKFLAPDMGTGVVYQYHLMGDGKVWRSPKSLNLTNNLAGPRHLARGKGSTVYLINEKAKSVMRIRGPGCAEGDDMNECESQTLLSNSTETKDDTAAAIRVSKDYKFLYASLRFSGESEKQGKIFVYRLGATGSITEKVGEYSTGGMHPRDFAIIENAPDCNSYVVVANRDSDNVVFFKRDRMTGKLASKASFTVKVGSPQSVLVA